MVFCGVGLLLAFMIFGRAVRQYVLLINGNQSQIQDMPVNTDIYNLDTSDVVTEKMLKLKLQKIR